MPSTSTRWPSTRRRWFLRCRRPGLGPGLLWVTNLSTAGRSLLCPSRLWPSLRRAWSASRRTLQSRFRPYELLQRRERQQCREANDLNYPPGKPTKLPLGDHRCGHSQNDCNTKAPPATRGCHHQSDGQCRPWVIGVQHRLGVGPQGQRHGARQDQEFRPLAPVPVGPEPQPRRGKWQLADRGRRQPSSSTPVRPDAVKWLSREWHG
jgi:hypothetical protein